MEPKRCNADEAFRCLSRASQSTNLKLIVVAQDLVDSGELPGPGSRELEVTLSLRSNAQSCQPLPCDGACNAPPLLRLTPNGTCPLSVSANAAHTCSAASTQPDIDQMDSPPANGAAPAD